MKDLIKILGIFFFGLLTAIIIYPMLHECGHSLIAVSVGAKVVDFTLFPLPSIMCDMFGVSNFKIALIGLGGIFIPYLISFVLRPKSFWIWYTNLIVRGISLLAIIISIVSILLWQNGISVQNEDIVQILNTLNDGAIPFLIVFLLMLIYGISKIILSRPIKKISEYFNI